MKASPSTAAVELNTFYSDHCLYSLPTNEDVDLSTWYTVVLRTEGMRKELDEEFHRVAPITFGYRNEELLGRSGGLESLSSEIRHFYFGNKKIDLESADNLTNLYTDTWFMCGIHEMALHLGISMPVYTGLFAHVSEHFSLTRNFGIQEILGRGILEINNILNSTTVYQIQN